MHVSVSSDVVWARKVSSGLQTHQNKLVRLIHVGHLLCTLWFSLKRGQAKHRTVTILPSDAPLDLRRADIGRSQEALVATIESSWEGCLHHVTIHTRYCVDLANEQPRTGLLDARQGDKLRIMEHVQRGGSQLFLSKG